MIDIKVRWSDADPAGIAFYPCFFEWFDMATEALFESLEMPWPVLFPRYRVVGVPIVDVGARFVSPVRYGDTVTVRASISEVREKTFRVDHDVSVGERHCASGFEVRAWVAQPDEPGGRLRAKALPVDVSTKLKGQGGAYA
jgi:YbgC/YbaW family acyl-CoA thioester hydrolase